MTDAPQTQPTLLVRIRDVRDREAWERFVDLYAPLVYGFLRKRGLQDADSADLTQDVLRQVSERAKNWEYDPQRGTFRGWLFTVVQNRLTDHWRKEGKREQGSGDTGDQKQINEIPHDQDGSSVWDIDYERQLFHYAAKIVKQDFTPVTWQAFWFTAVEGQSGSDVSKQLDLSVAAVYLAKGRVMKRLKDQVKLLVGDE
jgi:RNA polymerase sigma-70 factor (ECF subfamily)